MLPKIPLEYASVAFGVMWAGWMFWSSGPHDVANFAIWAVSGVICGYFWYLGMRWWSRRKSARDGADHSAS
jgi:hypothetical protein